MRRNAWRRFLLRSHKWIGIGIGLVLAMWLVTGLVMIQPAKGNVGGPRPVDYASVTVSPAEAVARARGDSTGLPPRQVELRQLGDHMYYVVRFPRMPATLIDGRTGDIFEITESLARSSVMALRDQPDILDATVITRHGHTYAFGPLPAYQYTLDDDQGTMVHVAIATGQVRVTTARARLIGAFGSWHTFRALRVLTPNRQVEYTLLMITGVIGLISVVTGYLIAFRRRARA